MFDASTFCMQTESNRPEVLLVTDANSDMESEIDIVEYAVWAAGIQMTVYPPEMRTFSKALAVLDAYLL